MKPHTPEWFEALAKKNPQQAEMTRQVLKLSGRDDVCSICGDDPANDYEHTESSLPVRLCDDCLGIQQGGDKTLFKKLA